MSSLEYKENSRVSRLIDKTMSLFFGTENTEPREEENDHFQKQVFLEKFEQLTTIKDQNKLISIIDTISNLVSEYEQGFSFFVFDCNVFQVFDSMLKAGIHNYTVSLIECISTFLKHYSSETRISEFLSDGTILIVSRYITITNNDYSLLIASLYFVSSLLYKEPNYDILFHESQCFSRILEICTLIHDNSISRSFLSLPVFASISGFLLRDLSHFSESDLKNLYFVLFKSFDHENSFHENHVILFCLHNLIMFQNETFLTHHHQMILTIFYWSHLSSMIIFLFIIHSSQLNLFYLCEPNTLIFEFFFLYCSPFFVFFMNAIFRKMSSIF